MKVKEKQIAINLRRRGLTYREIQEEVPVSRSSLSYWLRDIELTDKQVERVRYKNQLIKEKFIKYNKLKKREAEKRRNGIIEAAKREIDKISKRELKLLGIALYWAEGRKASARGGSVGFTNSDAGMIKLIMRWFREICRVPESKFRLSVMIHDPKRVKTVERYWSKLTGISLSQFIAPTLRISKTSQKKRGNVLPYGILTIRFSDVELFSKILGWIQGLGAPSSRGLGQVVLSHQTRVRLPLGLPEIISSRDLNPKKRVRGEKKTVFSLKALASLRKEKKN